MLAEYFTKPVEIKFGGACRRLVFTYRVLLGIDDLLRDLAGLSAVGFRRVLWRLLQRAGMESSIREVGRYVQCSDIPGIHAAILKAFRESLPEPREERTAGGEEVNFLETWAIARFALGLSDDEWLDMTPRQLAALQDQRIHQLQREELLTGILASAITNSGMVRPKKAVRPEDFMLHPFRGRAPAGEFLGANLLHQLRSLPRGAAKEVKEL